MSNSPRKQWTSFAEVKADLVRQGVLSQKNTEEKQIDSLDESLKEIVKVAETASTSKQLFETVCKLSAYLEKIDENEIKEFFRNSNLYVLILSAVFRNRTFLIEIEHATSYNLENPQKVNQDKEVIKSKIFLNTALSLAFFSIGFKPKFIEERSVRFLRKHITSQLKNILKSSEETFSFIDLCFSLEEAAWNHKYHHTSNFKEKYPLKLDGALLYETLKSTRSLVGSSMLALTALGLLGNKFRDIVSKIEEDKFSLARACGDLYDVIYRIEKGTNGYLKDLSDATRVDVENYLDSFIKKNEKNVLFFVKSVCAGLQFNEKKSFSEVVLEKIQTAKEVQGNVVNFGHSNLAAYRGKISDDDDEWSNKIFVITVKTLSLLSDLNLAADDQWKVSTAAFELREWMKEIHAIINKFYIEDEWPLIASFCDQEGISVEWKGSFWTLMEQPFINAEADIAKGKELFAKIVKTILGMLNTDGGVVIVGLVERPTEINRPQVISHLIKNHGLCFFDVGRELHEHGKNLDQVHLQLVNTLCAITDVSAEKFNNLIKLTPVLLRDSEKTISIVKIDVQKSPELLFNVKKEGKANQIWVSLTKRADRQTIDVDVRNYLD